MKEQTFMPIVLVIDDDKSITTYMRKNFHEKTPLGVLVANSMAEAKHLLDDDEVQINTIVTDLNFEKPSQDIDNNLYSGIDILNYSKEARPDAEQYVFSIWSDRNHEREKAKELNLQIKAWLNKMFYSPEDSEIDQAPWNKIYREQVTKLISENEQLDQMYKQQGFEEKSLNYIAEFINQLKPARMTFLQELNDDIQDLYSIRKPIKVLSTVQSDRSVIAKEMSIGILTEGIGDSVDEALDDLAEKIMSHKDLLDSEPDTNIGEFLKLVKSRLNDHIVRV